MKNYLIAGLLSASIPLTLSGMFLDIDDISRSSRDAKGEDKYSETVSIIKEGPDKASFAFSLSGLTSGFFGERKVPFAKVIVTISESSDKSTAINKTDISFDQSTDLARKETNKQFAEKWSNERQKFSESFLGKDKQQLDKNAAELQAKRFYEALKSVEEEHPLKIDEFFKSLGQKAEEPASAAQLAPKLEELAYALLSLRQ